MRAEQAWGAFSLVFALAVIAVAATLYSLGHDPYLAGSLAAVAIAVYLYVVYKRYHIELVTEGDLALFTDPDDLRILCEIYGLGSTGKPVVDRQRLRGFVRAHPEGAFVWVAPRPVRSVGSALEVPSPQPEELTVPAMMKKLLSDRPSDASLTGPLVGGQERSRARLAEVTRCPVCDSRPGRGQGICLQCGADLEFYSVLAGSRLGRKLISAKTEARRRKLRYPGPPMTGAKVRR
jgi:hypothetical protein